jgi:hypothetical protein
MSTFDANQFVTKAPCIPEIASLTLRCRISGDINGNDW